MVIVGVGDQLYARLAPSAKHKTSEISSCFPCLQDRCSPTQLGDQVTIGYNVHQNTGPNWVYITSIERKFTVKELANISGTLICGFLPEQTNIKVQMTATFSGHALNTPNWGSPMFYAHARLAGFSRAYGQLPNMILHFTDWVSPLLQLTEDEASIHRIFNDKTCKNK